VTVGGQGLSYIAFPGSHPDPAVCEQPFQAGGDRIARELAKPIQFLESALTERSGTPALAPVAAELAS
jgi:hypothetical protein